MLKVFGKEPGGAEIHEMTIRPSSRASAVLAQSVVSHSISASLFPFAFASQVQHTTDTFMNTRGEDVTHETSIHQSERDDTYRQSPTRAKHGEVWSGAEIQVQHVVDRNPGM